MPLLFFFIAECDILAPFIISLCRGWSITTSREESRGCGVDCWQLRTIVLSPFGTTDQPSAGRTKVGVERQSLPTKTAILHGGLPYGEERTTPFSPTSFALPSPTLRVLIVSLH